MGAVLADSVNTSYLLIGIAVGIVALFGAFFGFGAWLKRQWLRDGKLDELIDPKTGVLKVLQEYMQSRDEQDGAMNKRLDEVTRRLDRQDRSMRSNGLDTNQVGDIAKRTENAVKKLQESFDRHVGANDQEHKSIWRALRLKQDKATS